MTDHEYALRAIGHRRAKEETPIPGLDIVMDDGTILQPLNAPILPHDAWKSLACMKCGGRVYKAGKLHTVQEGWK